MRGFRKHGYLILNVKRLKASVHLLKSSHQANQADQTKLIASQAMISFQVADSPIEASSYAVTQCTYFCRAFYE